MTAAVADAASEVESAADYRVAPPYAEKFKEGEARAVIHACLQRRLTDARYHPDNTSTWAKEIADDIKQEMKEKGWLRYKFIVHVVRRCLLCRPGYVRLCYWRSGVRLQLVEHAQPWQLAQGQARGCAVASAEISCAQH